jgi:hypothetical protein
MLIAHAKFARFRNGLGHFAEVAVRLETPSPTPGIELCCAGTGYAPQGYFFDVSSKNFDDWKAGARAGVAFALSVAVTPAARVLIDRISGLVTDTNPIIIGGAAALAIWKALAFSPPPDVLERLEATVLTSWQRPANHVPELD